MNANAVIDQALKCDHANQYLEAVAKYLEALLILNNTLMELCRRSESHLGNKDFVKNLELTRDCLIRVCDIHNKQFKKQNHAIVCRTNGMSKSDSATMGELRDPLEAELHANRKLLSQFDETVRKQREHGTTPSELDATLRLEQKRHETRYSSQQEKRKGSEKNVLLSIRTILALIENIDFDDEPDDQCSSDHAKSERRSKSENASSRAPVDDQADDPMGALIGKYVRILEKDKPHPVEITHQTSVTRLPTLDDYFQPESVVDLSNDERQHQAAVLELIRTEQTHLRNLKILNILFRNSLIESRILSSGYVLPYLQMTMIDLLFANVAEVIDAHAKISDALNAAIRDRKPVHNIGEIMLHFLEGPFGEQFSQIVAKFCRHQQYAVDQLEIRRRQDTKFAKFLQQIEALPDCRGLTLGAMLPMEVQRLAKYPLLFERMIETATTKQNKDNLTRCRALARRIVQFVNAEKRRFESFHKLAELQCRLDPSRRPTFDLRGHTYVHDGQLTLHIGNSAIEVHTVLLEGYMLFLTKSSHDGYYLRLSIRDTSTSVNLNVSPIVALAVSVLKCNIMTPNSFCVETRIAGRPAAYNIEAQNSNEKAMWCGLISQEIEKAHNRPSSSKVLHQQSASMEQRDQAKVVGSSS